MTEDKRDFIFWLNRVATSKNKMYYSMFVMKGENQCFSDVFPNI